MSEEMLAGVVVTEFVARTDELDGAVRRYETTLKELQGKSRVELSIGLSKTAQRDLNAQLKELRSELTVTPHLTKASVQAAWRGAVEGQKFSLEVTPYINEGALRAKVQGAMNAAGSGFGGSGGPGVIPGGYGPSHVRELQQFAMSEMRKRVSSMSHDEAMSYLFPMLTGNAPSGGTPARAPRRMRVENMASDPFADPTRREIQSRLPSSYEAGMSRFLGTEPPPRATLPSAAEVARRRAYNGATSDVSHLYTGASSDATGAYAGWGTRLSPQYLENRAQSVLRQTFDDKIIPSLKGFGQRFAHDWDDKIKALEFEARRQMFAGLTLTTQFTAPAALAGAAGLNYAAGFQTQMAHVGALTEIGPKNIPSLTPQLLGLSKDLGRDPKELADGLYFVASRGYDAADSMKVLREATMASAAGMGQTSDVASSVTATLIAYGEGADKAAKYTDILTQMVKDGGGEASEYAKSLGHVIPLASQLKVSFTEVAASLATMTKIGLSPSESATALRQLLANLVNPTKEAKKVLDAMGTSPHQMLTDIKGKGLASVLQDITGKTQDPEVLSALVGNIRGLTGLLATAGNQSRAYSESLARMQNSAGATKAAFDAMEDTLGRQWERIASVGKATFLELSSKYLPDVTRKIEELGKQVPGAVDNMTASWASLPGPVQNAAKSVGAFLLLSGPLMTAGAVLKDVQAAGLSLVSGRMLGGMGSLNTLVLGGAAAWLAYRASTAQAGDEMTLLDKAAGALLITMTALQAIKMGGALLPGARSGLQSVGDVLGGLGTMGAAWSEMGTQGGFLGRASRMATTGRPSGAIGPLMASGQFAPEAGAASMAGLAAGMGPGMAITAPMVAALTVAVGAAATAWELYRARVEDAQTAQHNIEMSAQSMGKAIEKALLYAPTGSTLEAHLQELSTKAQAAGEDIGKLGSVAKDASDLRIEILADTNLDAAAKARLLEEVDRAKKEAESKAIQVKIELDEKSKGELQKSLEFIEETFPWIKTRGGSEALKLAAGGTTGLTARAAVPAFSGLYAGAGYFADAMTLGPQGGLFRQAAGPSSLTDILSGYQRSGPQQFRAPGRVTSSPQNSLDAFLSAVQHGSPVTAPAFDPSKLSTSNLRAIQAELSRRVGADANYFREHGDMRTRADAIQAELRTRKSTPGASGGLTAGDIPGGHNAKTDAERRAEAEAIANLQKQQSAWQAYQNTVEGLTGKVRAFGEETETARVKNEMLKLSLDGVSKSYRDQAVAVAGLFDKMQRLTGARDFLRGFYDTAQAKMVSMGNLGGAQSYADKAASMFGYNAQMKSLGKQYMTSAQGMLTTAQSNVAGLQAQQNDVRYAPTAGSSATAPSWLKAMEADSGKNFGRNCALEITAQLRGKGIGIGAISAASRSSAWQVGLDANGQLPPGTIVRYPPRRGGYYGGSMHAGHYAAVGSDGQHWTESNYLGHDLISTSRPINWAHVSSDVRNGVAYAFAPPGSVSRSAPSQQVGQTPGLPLPALANVRALNLLQTLPQNYDGSLMARAPEWMKKAWGAPVSENDPFSPARLEAQQRLFSRQGIEMLAGTATHPGLGAAQGARQIALIRSMMNQLDAASRQSAGARQLASDLRSGARETYITSRDGNPYAGLYYDYRHNMLPGGRPEYLARRGMLTGSLQASALSDYRTSQRGANLALSLSALRARGLAGGLSPTELDIQGQTAEFREGLRLDPNSWYGRMARNTPNIAAEYLRRATNQHEAKLRLDTRNTAQQDIAATRVSREDQQALEKYSETLSAQGKTEEEISTAVAARATYLQKEREWRQAGVPDAERLAKAEEDATNAAAERARLRATSQGFLQGQQDELDNARYLAYGQRRDNDRSAEYDAIRSSMQGRFPDADIERAVEKRREYYELMERYKALPSEERDALIAQTQAREDSNREIGRETELRRQLDSMRAARTDDWDARSAETRMLRDGTPSALMARELDYARQQSAIERARRDPNTAPGVADEMQRALDDEKRQRPGLEQARSDRGALDASREAVTQMRQEIELLGARNEKEKEAIALKYRLLKLAQDGFPVGEEVQRQLKSESDEYVRLQEKYAKNQQLTDMANSIGDSLVSSFREARGDLGDTLKGMLSDLGDFAAGLASQAIKNMIRDAIVPHPKDLTGTAQAGQTPDLLGSILPGVVPLAGNIMGSSGGSVAAQIASVLGGVSGHGGALNASTIVVNGSMVNVNGNIMGGGTMPGSRYSGPQLLEGIVGSLLGGGSGGSGSTPASITHL